MGKKIQFGHILMLFGILSQVLTYIITKDSLLSFISGLTGVFAVVLCSEKKMSYYFFSILQMLTFSIICYHEQLYGKIFENAFYFILAIIGIFLWKNNLDDENLVEPKKMDFKGVLMLLFSISITTLISYYILAYMGGKQPFMDGFTTVIGIVANILMMLRFRENWILWFITDVLCIVLFLRQENWCMVVQYVFWTINTVYGFIK